MLEMNNSYVRLFVTIDEHMQSGLLPVCHAVWSCSRTISGTVNIAVDTCNMPSTNEKVTILILVESRAVRFIIIQHRTIDCHTTGLQDVLEMHSSWGRETTSLRVSSGHTQKRQGEVSHRYRILLLATDAAWRSKRHAAWWPAVPAVSYRCLCENRTAAIKLSAV